MKSVTRKFLTAAAALTVGLAGIASAQTTLEDIQERGYIQIATANEVPYGYVNATGDAEGIAPDVATAVLNNLGIDDIQWVVTQFGSLIPGLIAATDQVFPKSALALVHDDARLTLSP